MFVGAKLTTDHFLLYYLVLDDSYEVGAAGGGGAGEDEADGVSHDFQDDDPPRVVGFHACLLGFLGVGQDGVDLLFAEFYFHVFFGFGCLIGCSGCQRTLL